MSSPGESLTFVRSARSRPPSGVIETVPRTLAGAASRAKSRRSTPWPLSTSVKVSRPGLPAGLVRPGSSPSIPALARSASTRIGGLPEPGRPIGITARTGIVPVSAGALGRPFRLRTASSSDRLTTASPGWPTLGTRRSTATGRARDPAVALQPEGAAVVRQGEPAGLQAVLAHHLVDREVGQRAGQRHRQVGQIGDVLEVEREVDPQVGAALDRGRVEIGAHHALEQLGLEHGGHPVRAAGEAHADLRHHPVRRDLRDDEAAVRDREPAPVRPLHLGGHVAHRRRCAR